MIQKIMTNIKSLKWGAIISLGVIYLSVFTGWYWLWGLLLLYWAAFDLIYEQCWLTETIEKHHNPVLYYLIVLTWLTLGFYFLISPFIYLLR